MQYIEVLGYAWPWQNPITHWWNNLQLEKSVDAAVSEGKEVTVLFAKPVDQNEPKKF